MYMYALTFCQNHHVDVYTLHCNEQLTSCSFLHLAAIQHTFLLDF